MQAMQVDRMTEDTQLQRLREREGGRKGGRQRGERQTESTDQGKCMLLICRRQRPAGSVFRLPTLSPEKSRFCGKCQSENHVCYPPLQ